MIMAINMQGGIEMIAIKLWLTRITVVVGAATILLRGVFELGDLLRNELPATAQALRAAYNYIFIATSVSSGFAYYEVDKSGKVTSDGALRPADGSSMPDYQAIHIGLKLRAEHAAYLREQPSRDSFVRGVISNSECVEVIGAPLFKRETVKAASGGYLSVKRITC